MQFSSINEFIAMGGHGFYVWLSYGFTALSLVLLLIASLHSNKTIRKNIAKKLRRDEKLKAVLAKQAEQTKQDNDPSF
ncbi:MAG: heme exporter protein CcmD [Thalassotalea sp.]